MTDQLSDTTLAPHERNVTIRLGSMSSEEIKTKIRTVIERQQTQGWTWIGMSCHGTLLVLQFKAISLT